MEVFNKKLSQKERQLNYYYSKKGQDTYKQYYEKHKDKIATYAKEYREKKKQQTNKAKNEENNINKKNNNYFKIEYGKFIVSFD